MGNEVIIEVTGDNSGLKATLAESAAMGAEAGKKPITVKAQLALDQVNGPDALTKEIAKGAPVKVPVTASNPINDAWVAQVRSSVKSLASQALDIPVEADMVPFTERLQEVLADLSTTSKADIPVDVGDAMIFRSQVDELVAQVEASTKAVIDIEVNDEGLSDLQSKTLAASQSTLDLVAAEQKLNTAMASGDDEAIAKARNDVVTASKAAKAATVELAAAQEEAGVAEEAAAAGTATFGDALRALNSAMGPMWMIMQIAQIAMFAFGSSSSSTAKQAQDASSSIISLGQSAGQTAQNMLMGNAALQGLSGDLTRLGSSSAQFASVFGGNLQTAQNYTKQLEDQQKKLGASFVSAAEAANAPGWANAGQTIAQVTEVANRGKSAYDALPASLRAQVDEYNHLADVVPQAKAALAGMQAAALAEKQTLDSVGFSLTANEQQHQNYGLAVQAAAKALADATAGSTYLEDSTDKASITAGQAVQQWQQLNATYLQSKQAATQAAEGVANAEHGVVTAEQGVESALHSQQAAVRGVKQAQDAYTESVYQEQQAQQAVTAARAAAKQQLIDLQLQANDASTSVESANLALFQAQQNASKYGVNKNNAAAIAGEQITAANEAQVEAAIALLQAENALADAQNSSTQTQDQLNTARKQGVNGNPQVLAAEHALQQSQNAVAQAAQGVADAQYAEQQAAIQVANAEWGLRQAHQQVAAAEVSERNALVQLNTAQDNLTRSTDQNTLAGAQNRQMIESIFRAYEAEYGNEQLAAQATENVGTKMHFTAQQIQGVIGKLLGLNGTRADFSIVGTPSLNPQQLTQIGEQLGMSFSQIEAILPTRGAHGAKAAGGPGGGLTWVGEQGPELVRLPYGTEVIPSANSMQMALLGDVAAPHHAAGGPVGASSGLGGLIGPNLPIAAQWGALATVGNSLYALGGPQVRLPAATAVDMGVLAAGAGFGSGNSQLSGDRAANKAIMQAVFSTFGWGTGAQWAAQDYLEMREAGYNNLAQNPTSTAFGMAQFLDSTWGAYGFRKTADPYVQSLAMATYERARYGDPIHAAQHERVLNWYGGGGPAGGLIGVGEYGPELLRVPGGSSVVPHANAMQALAQTPVEVKVKLEFGGGDSAFASAFKMLVRTGQIRITSTTGTVVVS
jgi:hypothetical protein